MVPSTDILIVDDEVGIRELLSEILQDEGYRVSLAENATEARTYRSKQQPALVLLDIWMPDTDGVTLLREWAASGQLTMPVVMMSGHGTIETAVEATKIGAFDFLEKPVGLQKLLGTVARALKTTLAKEPRRVSLACARHQRRDSRRRARDRAAARGEEAGAAAGRARHRARDGRARAATGRRARGSRLPSGTRLAGNPLAVLDEARDGTLYCARDRAVREGRAEGPRVPAAEARARRRDARVHERRAARQSRRRGQVRSGAARRAFDRRRPAAAAALAARGHSRARRAHLARHPDRAEGRRARPGALGLAAGRRR